MDLLQKMPPTTELLFVPVVKTGSQDGLWVSKETYWREYYNDPDFVYEWNKGYLEEKGVSKRATTAMYFWFVKLLQLFLEVHPIAEITGLETAFELELPDKSTVRRPDLAVYLKNNPVQPGELEDKYGGTFDLCIEALSDTNRQNIERDTKVKKKEYAQAGVREFYILDGVRNKMAFYALNKWGKYSEIQAIDGDVIRSQILPGFQFRISDLYRQPTANELVKDEVYQHFVMTDYQTERQRADQAENQIQIERQKAEQAEQKADQATQIAEKAQQKADQATQIAEQEKQKADQATQIAEQEKQKAEHLAAYLQELGVSADEILKRIS